MIIDAVTPGETVIDVVAPIDVLNQVVVEVFADMPVRLFPSLQVFPALVLYPIGTL